MGNEDEVRIQKSVVRMNSCSSSCSSSSSIASIIENDDENENEDDKDRTKLIGVK